MLGPEWPTVMLDSDSVAMPLPIQACLPVILMHLLPVLRFTDLLQLCLQLIHIRVCVIGVPFEGVDKQRKDPRAKPGRSSILRKRGICNHTRSTEPVELLCPMLSTTHHWRM